MIVPAEFVMDFPPWESVGVVRDLEDKIITGISTKWGPMSKLVCNSNNYCSWKFMAFMVLITNELLGFYIPTDMAISWGYWSAVPNTGKNPGFWPTKCAPNGVKGCKRTVHRFVCLSIYLSNLIQILI